MRYGSVCSGIEAASVAWEPLGWEPAFFAEVEPFPCAVLAHHWPHVPNLGDMTKIDGAAWRGLIDVLVGGTPCQAFSIAGARRGLEDARGNLTLHFARLADAIQPDYIVWENVPGVLSDKTNAFGCLLGMLAGEDEALVPPGGKWTNAGYVLGPERTIAWIVKDAQYFGVAQRRRRVFLVACPRNGADPREILFEREGVRRDSAPSREAGQGTAGSAEAGVGGGGEPVAWSTKLHNTQSNQAGKWYEGYTPSLDRNSPAPAVFAFAQNSRDEVRLQGGDGKICGALSAEPGMKQTTYLAFGGNNTSGPIDVATARNACSSSSGRLDFETETFITQPVAVSLRGREGGATAEVSGECCPALRASQGGGDKPHVLAPVAFDTTQITSPSNYSRPRPGDPCHPLAAGAHPPAITFPANMSGTQCAATENLSPALGAKNPTGVAHQMRVRRLTPVECARLQGFPDHHTLISWRGKPASECPDGPRYKALGNSMATPCMRWIGQRIELVASRSAKPQTYFSRILSAFERITESLERRAA